MHETDAGGQSKMQRNGKGDREEEEEDTERRTRIFSTPITIDCRRSSDAYRDGSSFQSSGIPFLTVQQSERSGDI